MSFRITVRRGGTDLWWFPPGVQKPNVGAIPIDDLRLKTVQMLGRWLAEGNIKKREELVILGSHLYRILFEEAVDKAFMEARASARKSKNPLRVVLEFEPNTDHLALLPWEYLYRPDGPGGAGFFVAADDHLVLARYVSLVDEDRWAEWKEQEALKILIVISAPRDLDIVAPGPALTYLDGLKIRSGGKLVIETLKQPSKKDFEEALEKHQPHIVHFIGHGKYDNEGGAIAFVSNGNAIDVSEQDFVACFEKCDTRLAFLEVCQGAASQSYTAFSGIALKLIQNRIPAVMAMRYQVSNDAANAFSLKFYQQLQSGQPIDRAVQAGRNDLGKYLTDTGFSSREFGCPVLFLQTAEDMDTRGVIPFPPLDPKGEDDSGETEAEPPDPISGMSYFCPQPGCRGIELNTRYRRCDNCGNEWRLHSCGEPIRLTAKFCAACGKAVSRAGSATACTGTAVSASASAFEGASRPQAEKFLESTPLPPGPDTPGPSLRYRN